MVTKVDGAIIFDDLGAPNYSRLQKLVLKLGEKQDVIFTQEAVLGKAMAATGLADFGPEDFKPRLQLLLDDYNGQALSGVGRGQMFADLVRCASNRLIIQHKKKQHATSLSRTQIARPLTVAGLPRSGTTHLVNLLASDSRFQKLPLWEAQEPFHAPGKENASLGLRIGAKSLAALLGNKDSPISDSRYLRCSLRWSGMKIMGPEIAAMHPMNPDHIHEELELMTYDFGCNQFEWTAWVPSFRDHYYADDQTPQYDYMSDVMKLLQIERGDTRPWVTKCVQNPEQLPALKHIWPDASVIFTHRDPVAVIQSTCTMLAWGQRMMQKKPEPHKVMDYWIERFEKLLRACVRDRHIWPKSQSTDILFHEYMADQMGTIAKIYDLHDMEFTEKARSEMEAYISAHPRGKYGRVKYDLKGHFGRSAEEIRERFDFYLKAFPVKIEI
jgi:hypothetical protein